MRYGLLGICLTALLILGGLVGCNSDTTVPGSTLTGRVVDTGGAPVNGATVQLLSGSVVEAQTITISNGEFTFTDVQPGAYRVLASSVVAFNPVQVVSAPFNFTNVNMQLPQLLFPTAQDLTGVATPAQATLAVFVRTSTGLPVQATVQVEGVSNPVTHISPVIIPVVPIGAHTVTIFTAGQTIIRTDVPFNQGAITVLNETVSTNPSGVFTVSGTVRNTSGQTLGSRTVQLFQGSVQVAQTISALNSGVYTFTDVEPGTYTAVVTTTVNGIPVRVESAPIVVTNADVTGADITLPIAQDLFGITQPQLGGLMVFANDQFDQPLQTTVQVAGLAGSVTDVSPIFMPEVPLGTHTVAVTAGGFTQTLTTPRFFAGTITVLNTTFTTI